MLVFFDFRRNLFYWIFHEAKIEMYLIKTRPGASDFCFERQSKPLNINSIHHSLLVLSTFNFLNVNFFLWFLAFLRFFDINRMHNFDVGHFDLSILIIFSEVKCSRFNNWLSRKRFVQGNLTRGRKITRDCFWKIHNVFHTRFYCPKNTKTARLSQKLSFNFLSSSSEISFVCI